MAKKPSKKTESRTKPGKPKTKAPVDPRAAIIDAALELAGQLGWRDLRLAEIAEAAGVEMTEMYDVMPDKTAIVADYMQRVDKAVAGGGPTDVSESVRDRLFDVVMRRFDALQADRAGVAAIVRDLITDPAALVCLLGTRRRSLNWMLELAGVGSDGLRGRMRARGLEVILLSTIRVWLKDDSPDMSATMAHLDRALSRVDQVLSMVKNRGRRTDEVA